MRYTSNDGLMLLGIAITMVFAVDACVQDKAADDDDESSLTNSSGETASTASSGGTAQPLCMDSCSYAFDGECDDGGPGSMFAECAYGTDCADCGPRDNTTTSSTTATSSSSGSDPMCVGVGETGCSYAPCCYVPKADATCHDDLCCISGSFECTAAHGDCCAGFYCVEITDYGIISCDSSSSYCSCQRP